MDFKKQAIGASLKFHARLSGIHCEPLEASGQKATHKNERKKNIESLEKHQGFYYSGLGLGSASNFHQYL